MNSFDKELKKALRRQEPPPDFAESVLARIKLVPPTRKRRWAAELSTFFRLPALRWATAAALCLLVAIGVITYRQHQRAVQQRTLIEGERARAIVLLALRITSSKLNVALRDVKRAERPQRN